MMMIFMSFLSLILFFFYLNSLLFQFFFIMIFISIMKLNFFLFFCSISYFFGLDFYSFWMMFLLIFIFILMFMSFNLSYSLCFFFLNMFLFMNLAFVFLSLNMLVMYFFFELSLIPMVLLIFGWGYQPERLTSGFYLFFYTLFSSLPLLIFMVFFFNFNSLFFDLNFSLFFSFYFNVCLIFSFLVKFPMFMFHFWLPKAHVQAPLIGSMVLAGVLLKIGGYVMIRFMFMFEEMFFLYNFVWYSISLYGCMFVSYSCMIQYDMKYMIAYSSISHMGLCIMGLSTFTKVGFLGSYLMMISHGFCSSAMFCLASFFYAFTKSRSFFLNKGMFSYFPSLGLFWFIFCSFNMSSPPSVNFLAEFFIMNSLLSYCSFSLNYMFMIFIFVSYFNFYLFSYLNHGQCYYSFSIKFCSLSDYFLIFFQLVYLIYFNFYFMYILF